MTTRIVTITALALALTACGGSGSSTEPSATDTAGTTPETTAVATTSVETSEPATTTTEPASDPAYEAAVCELFNEGAEQKRPSEQFTFVADGLAELTPPAALAEQQQAIIASHQALAEAWLSTTVQADTDWLDQLHEVGEDANTRGVLAPECTSDLPPNSPSISFLDAQYAGDVAGVWLYFTITCPDGTTLTDLDERLVETDEDDVYALLADGPQGPVGKVRPLDADVAFGASRPLAGSCE